MRVLTSDPQVVSLGSGYLRIVGPTYGLYGAGFGLYAAWLGAGRPLWPLVVSAARLVVAAGGAYLALHLADSGPTGVFVAIASAFAAFGLTLAAATALTSWRT